MPLPADFPPAPVPPRRRPPATEPIGSKAWLDYFTDLDRFNAEQAAYAAAVRERLDSL